MNCEHSRGRMIDFLYGEELGSDQSFAFFQHLQECDECKQEYRELLETREVLAQWNGPDEVSVEEARIVPAAFPTRSRPRWWWTMLPKVAAGILIVLGVVSLAQTLGWWERRQLGVTEQELAEMFHDLTVLRQTEDQRMIGAMLLQVKDDLEQARRQDLALVYDYFLQELERQSVVNQEENHRYLSSLVTR